MSTEKSIIIFVPDYNKTREGEQSHNCCDHYTHFLYREAEQ